MLEVAAVVEIQAVLALPHDTKVSQCQIRASREMESRSASLEDWWNARDRVPRS